MKKPVRSSVWMLVASLSLLAAMVVGPGLVRNYLIQQNEMLVHSVAQNVLPALLVNDEQQVRAVLKSLESHPGVRYVELVSSEGATIASLGRVGDQLSTDAGQFELASAQMDGDNIQVAAPVSFDSLILANIHIAVNLWPTYLKLMTWFGLMLIIPSVGYFLVQYLNIRIRFEKLADGSDENGPSRDARSNFDLDLEVEKAMQEAKITVEYQPLHRLSDGGVFGVELIVCWKHPSGQTIHLSPADFAMLAQKWGMFFSVEEWVLRTACKQVAAWHRKHGPLVLSFNLSQGQWMNPEFAQTLRNVAVQAGYPYQLIEFELSESMLTKQPSYADAVGVFVEQGLNLTVDAFGLSRQATSIFETVPLNKIKLDAKLVANLERDASIRQLVKETIDLASAHDIQVMADGVDSKSLRHTLRDLGCIVGQGAHFSVPLSSAQCEQYLTKRAAMSLSNRPASVAHKVAMP